MLKILKSDQFNFESIWQVPVDNNLEKSQFFGKHLVNSRCGQNFRKTYFLGQKIFICSRMIFSAKKYILIECRKNFVRKHRFGKNFGRKWTRSKVLSSIERYVDERYISNLTQKISNE